MSEIENQMEELWHNLFRMHSYVEAALNPQGEERPPLLQRADTLLTASFARVKTVLPENAIRRLETPHAADYGKAPKDRW